MSSKGANTEHMEWMESENKPIPIMIPNDALSLKGWMMGRELEGLTRTPIIQRNSYKGGKEKAHLIRPVLLSTTFERSCSNFASTLSSYAHP